MGALFQLLDNHIGRSTRRWLKSGYHMGIANICAVTGYGDPANPIAAALKAFSRANPKSSTEPQDQPMQEATASETPSPNAKVVTPNSANQLPNALRLLTGTYDVVCRRFGDPNILVFLLLESDWFPAAAEQGKVVKEGGLKGAAGLRRRRPLPDDFALRGFPWVEKYLPDGWFVTEKIDDDEKYFERASMTEERRERVVWLGCRIAERRAGI